MMKGPNAIVGERKATFQEMCREWNGVSVKSNTAFAGETKQNDPTLDRLAVA
jgi:hypothetical protein